MTYEQWVMLEVAKRCQISDLRASELKAVTQFVIHEVQRQRNVITDLVEESRKGFHDSTVWEDEEYVGEYSDIAKRWAAVNEGALLAPGPDGGSK